MKTLGLDIGTTTISAVVLENGAELDSLTLPNGGFLTGCAPWERIQDPLTIRATVMQAVEALFARWPDIRAIGVTGQMHGIVYLDASGAPVSSLYTWQDGRGEQLRGGQTYAGYLSGLTGYPLATGHGLVTHFYNQEHGLVPENAAVLCTIHDYAAMSLCGLCTPCTDAGDAASLGMFDLRAGAFDRKALELAGIDAALLPRVAAEPYLGSYQGRADVFTAIGDNQASFLGATGGDTNAMLVNVGTGSQFSVYVPEYMQCPGLETRPFPGGGYLLVGASLCGGRAYALLERFFREMARMLGAERESCYDDMERLLESAPEPQEPLRVLPLFQGTRQTPELRGSISGISAENFTPLHLLWGMMHGMADELHEMYRLYKDAGGEKKTLIGSGNGLRKNRFLRRCMEEAFGETLTLPEVAEEAAAGAAIFAAQCEEAH